MHSHIRAISVVTATLGMGVSEFIISVALATARGGIGTCSVVGGVAQGVRNLLRLIVGQ